MSTQATAGIPHPVIRPLAVTCHERCKRCLFLNLHENLCTESGRDPDDNKRNLTECTDFVACNTTAEPWGSEV